MKTNKFFLLAAIAFGTALSFTSCSNEDNTSDRFLTISFEDQKLNEDGVWYGDVNGTPYDAWGSTAYACNYTEDGVKFPINYMPAWYSWSGYAISGREESTFSGGNWFLDQFNNVTGKAKSGKNFCVIYTFGEQITFARPVTVKGFWYTNDAYTVDAILNGDGMSPGKFEADDYLKCILFPEPAEGLGGARYEIDLAKDGDYVKEWKYCDLRDVDAFKNIKSISFNFDGSKKNAGGLTTPTYICIDDIEIQY